SLRAAGAPIDLRVHRQDVAIGQRIGRMIALNGSAPGPLLRLKEGEDLTIRVHNALTEDARSIGMACCCPSRWTAFPA
ncbi:MAG: multicopper oxidase domain-containing protein, partial [Candidatus Macondimonas sp.]